MMTNNQTNADYDDDATDDEVPVQSITRSPSATSSSKKSTTNTGPKRTRPIEQTESSSFKRSRLMSNNKDNLVKQLLEIVESCTAECTEDQLELIIEHFPIYVQTIQQNQSNNQSNNQPNNQPNNQSINQTTNQSNNQTISQSINQTMKQTISQSINQQSEEAIGQSIKQMSNSSSQTVEKPIKRSTDHSNKQSRSNDHSNKQSSKQPRSTDHSNKQSIKKSREKSNIQSDNHLAIYTTLRELYKIDTLNLDSVQTVESSLSTIMSVLKKLPEKALEWQQALESKESLLSVISLPLIYENLSELENKFHDETRKCQDEIKKVEQEFSEVNSHLSSTEEPLAYSELLYSLQTCVNNLQNLANRSNWFLMNKEICVALKSAQTDEVNIQTYLKKVHQTHEQLIRKLVNIFDQHTTIVTAKTQKM